MSHADRMRIGYIPLVDAGALIVAVDAGFATAEGLDVELVREVSWSNVRDKLNIGLFDAAHLLSPVAIASSLGIGHVRVPLAVPYNLGLNGNAITVAPSLKRALADAAAPDGDLTDPTVSARALARLVAHRKTNGQSPLTFGMTFPFSNHSYQLRFWMAAGGADPDEDVRLVVLPPPYMAESLASGHVDGFCVGAPWNSVAVHAGIGCILHFGCDIVARCSEKVLAVRADWATQNDETVQRLIRACWRAARFIADAGNRGEVADLVAARIGVEPEFVRRTLAGTLRLTRNGPERTDDRYLMVGPDAARPDPMQAAWLYAQMVRWGQAAMSPDLLAMARAVFRPDLFDAALGRSAAHEVDEPADGVGAFAGPVFNPDRIASDLATWAIRRA